MLMLKIQMVMRNDTNVMVVMMTLLMMLLLMTMMLMMMMFIVMFIIIIIIIIVVHLIHTQLSTIFYTHVEHSSTNATYIKYYLKQKEINK